MVPGYAFAVYLVTARVAISLIHETSHAKRRRSIIFIFSLTAHSTRIVPCLDKKLAPSVPLFPLKYRCREEAARLSKKARAVSIPPWKCIKMHVADGPPRDSFLSAFRPDDVATKRHASGWNHRFLASSRVSTAANFFL